MFHDLGIGINELRNDLMSGIRLPSPEFCPSRILELIQHCFQQEPQGRPNFKMIKEAIQESYKSLVSKDDVFGARKGTHSTPTVYLHLSPIDQTTSNEMMERYRILKNENKKKTVILKTNEGLSKQESERVVLNPALSTASFTNIPDRYASLENINTPSKV